MLAAIIAVQIMWFGHYHASGHAAGHLASATMIFAVAFALAVLVWASPPPLRQRPEVWALAAAVATSALIPTVGKPASRERDRQR